jgi:hypothetical protein
VRTARATGTAPGSLRACLEEKVMRWRFPAPRGGGVVIVRYPFVFRAER